MQSAATVRQPLVAAQDLQGGSVRRQHAAATVQVQDADPARVQQAGQAGAQRIGVGQSLTYADELADVRRQGLDQPDVVGLPTVAADRIAE